LSVKLDLHEASACKNKLDVGGLSRKKFLGLKEKPGYQAGVIPGDPVGMEKLSD
jgi:hypothetical protein